MVYLKSLKSISEKEGKLSNITQKPLVVFVTYERIEIWFNLFFGQQFS